MPESKDTTMKENYKPTFFMNTDAKSSTKHWQTKLSSMVEDSDTMTKWDLLLERKGGSNM